MGHFSIMINSLCKQNEPKCNQYIRMDSHHFMERNVQFNAAIRKVDSHHPQLGSLFGRENGISHHHFSREMIEVQKNFRCRIDQLFFCVNVASV